MIKVDFTTFITDRIWFGWFWTEPDGTYDPLALNEVFTFRHYSGWNRSSTYHWTILDRREHI